MQDAVVGEAELEAAAVAAAAAAAATKATAEVAANAAAADIVAAWQKAEATGLFVPLPATPKSMDYRDLWVLAMQQHYSCHASSSIVGPQRSPQLHRVREVLPAADLAGLPRGWQAVKPRKTSLHQQQQQPGRGRGRNRGK
jgi:hypothetical protein